MKNPQENKLFKTLSFFLFLTMIVKLWVIMDRDMSIWQNFKSIYLWKCLLVSIIGYFLILFLSILYAKILRTLSVPFIFIVSFFLFYFFSQISIMVSSSISEATTVRALLFFLTIFIIYRVFIKNEKILFQMYKPDILDLLIFLWIILSGVYFLNYNFDLKRELYVDEWYWFQQAKAMVDMPPQTRILNKLMEPHLIGIPFIAAFPNILLGTHLEGSFFFMSGIVIVAIAWFLNLIKEDRWCFIFFFTALIMTLNRHLWLRKLHLGLIYGHGINGCLFLFAIYELIKIARRNINFSQLLLLSFCLGLLAYIKMPLSYVFLSFIPILLFINPLRFKLKLVVLILFISPILVKHLIIMLCYRGYVTGYSTYIHGLDSLFHYNFSQIKPMFIYLLGGYTVPLYFSALSIVFILLTFRGKEFFFVIPIICLVAFIFYLYITVFSNVEYESSARYLSEGMLALYYLGGIGFRKVVYILFKKDSYSMEIA